MGSNQRQRALRRSWRLPKADRTRRTDRECCRPSECTPTRGRGRVRPPPSPDKDGAGSGESGEPVLNEPSDAFATLGETRPAAKVPTLRSPGRPLRERGPACTPNEVARAWISSPQDQSGSINCSATIRG